MLSSYPEKREASSSGRGSARPSSASAASRAVAGPVEIPQGPWPAAIQRLSIPPAGPTSGRPSSDCGRAQARAPSTRARESAGTNGSPARRSCPAQVGASGSSARKVEPTETEPLAATMLKIDSGGAAGSPPDFTPASPSTPSCSSTWRGGSSTLTSSTTPQTGTIGRQARVGAITSGAHGPAATSTPPAAKCRPPAPGPPHPRPGREVPPAGQHAAHAAAQHPGPGGSALVELGARAAGALGEAERGRRRLDRVARLEPAAPDLAAQARLDPPQLARVQQGGLKLRLPRGDLGHRRHERRALARQQQHARGLLRQVEPVELTVVAQRLLVELGEHRVERVLDRPGVAAGRGARKLPALEQLDPGARLGEEGRRCAPDDPAADDRDARRERQAPGP